MAPGVPTGFAMASRSAETLEVTWDDLPGGVTPRLQVQEAGGDWSEIVHMSTGTEPHEITSLVGNTRYDLRLRAESGGAYSDWVMLENELTLPAAPGGFSCAASGYQSGFLTWEKLPGCLYTLSLGETVLVSDYDNDYLTVSYVSDTDVYALVAVNAVGASERSETPGVYGGGNPPSCETLPTISANESGLFTITEGTCGGDPAPTSSWQWLLCDDAGNYLEDIAGQTAQTFQATFLMNGSALRVRETWGNPFGSDSQISEPTAYIDLPVSAPTGFAISERTAATMTLSWDHLADSISYHVQCAVAGTGFGSLVWDQEAVSGTTLEISSLMENTAYDVRIQAEFAGSYDPSEWVVLAGEKTRLAEPEDFAFSSATLESITLVWDPLPGGVHSVIEWQAYGGGWESPSAAMPTGSSYTITGLEGGLVYDVRLRAEKSGALPSIWMMQEQVPTLPLAPANLVCNAMYYHSGRLMWDAAPGCTYMVQRNADLIESSLNGNTYDVSYATESDTYYVTAVNLAGAGAPSSTPGNYGGGSGPEFVSPPTITVDEDGLYTAHEGACSGDPNPVHDSWLWLLCDGDGVFLEELTGETAATYQPTLEQTGRTLRVRETCVSELGSASAESDATPPVIMPLHAPTNFTVATHGETSLDLTWDAQGGEITFRVQWAESAGTLDSPLGEQDGITDAGLLVSGLTANMAYQVRVRAESEDGMSDWVTLNDQYTLPAAPTGLSATATEYQNGQLTWDTLPGCTYNVYRNSAAFAYGLTDGFCQEAYTSDADFYEVAAVNAAGEGARSSVACAYGGGTSPTFNTFPTISTEDNVFFTANAGTYSGTPDPEHAGWQWLLCTAGGDYLSDISGATDGTFQAGFLLNGHSLRVRETCANSAGSASQESDPTMVLEVPLPEPENFALSSRTTDTLTLTWDALGDGMTYHVQWVGSGGSFDSFQGEQEGITDTTVTLDSLMVGGAYDVRLRAEFEGSYGDWTVLTALWTQLPEPSMLAVNASRADGFDLGWESLPEGVTATVEWQAQGGTWETPLGSSSYIDTGLCSITGVESNTAYDLRVRADQGVDLHSAWVTLEGQYTLPPAPTGFTATAEDSGGVTLAADARPAGCSLAVSRGVSGAFEDASLLADDVAADSYFDDSGDVGSEYLYYLRNKNSAGYSAPTDAAAAISHGPPVNVLAPTIARADGSGAPVVPGTTLTLLSEGAWTGYPQPTIDHLHWLRWETDVTYVEIPGETGAEYTTTGEDVNNNLGCNVYYANELGAVPAQSNPIFVSADDGGGGGGGGGETVPSFTSAPTISSSDGITFTAHEGTYAGDPAPYHNSWQWLLCDAEGNEVQELAGETSATYHATALQNGCTLRVRETCSNNLDTTAADSEATTALSVPLLDAPTSFTVTERTASSLALAWEMPAGMLTSHVQWVTSGGSFDSPEGDSAGITDVATTIGGLPMRTAYDVRLRIESADNFSEWVVLENERTLLAPPSGFDITERTTESVSFSWDAMMDISTVIQWKNPDDLWDSPLGETSTTGNTYDLTGLETNAVYNVRYRTEADSGLETSEWTELEVYMLPPVPTGFTATGINGGVYLSADARPAGCLLAVLRDSDAGMAAATMIADDVDADSYVDNAVGAGEEYHYALQNKNPGGYSERTDEMMAAALAAVQNGVPPVVARTDGLTDPAPPGTELTLMSEGEWNGFPPPAFDHLQWQWYNADGMYEDIPGATGTTYVVTTDYGSTLACSVFYTNEVNTASCLSNPITTTNEDIGTGGGDEGGGGGDEGGGEGEP